MAAKGRQPKIDTKQFKRDIAALKKAGLVSAKVDARTQRPTRHMLAKIAKFDDVLKGRAKTVLVPKASARKEYAGYRQANKRVVIPVQSKDVQVRYSKKTGDISAVTTRRGERVRQRFPRLLMEGIPEEPKRKKRVEYVMTFPRGGGSVRTDSWEELSKLMKSYNLTGTKRSVPFDWRQYVTAFEYVGKTANVTKVPAYDRQTKAARNRGLRNRD